MKKFPVCKACKRKTKTQKDTCCQLLWETTHPKIINWFKKPGEWIRVR